MDDLHAIYKYVMESIETRSTELSYNPSSDFLLGAYAQLHALRLHIEDRMRQANGRTQTK